MISKILGFNKGELGIQKRLVQPAVQYYHQVGCGQLTLLKDEQLEG